MIYEKMTFWSLLSHSRLSKREATNEFAFIGLVKQNDERPYLGTNPSFLRFIKYVRIYSSLDEIQWGFVTLFGLVKIKRGTHPSDKSNLICFMNLRKDGFIPKIGSFIVLFYESDESKLICHFMFREYEMTKKSQEWNFS